MSEEYYLKQVKKCVTFIFIKTNGSFYPVGTGFFVGIEITGKEIDYKDISNYHFAIYLVTAYHVLLDNDGNLFKEIYIRVNRKKGIPEFIPINLEEIKKTRNVHRHSDLNVDLAAFIFYPPQEEYDILYILTNSITTKEFVNEKINEGDEVFYAGLFASYYGKEKNYPLLRFGRVSLITNEPIEINQISEPQKLAHIYLFEIQSYNGNSGSPVFYQVPRLREDGKIAFRNPEIHLVGVLKGHYNDIRLRKIVDLNDNVLQQLNSGIAMVTPSYYLREILLSDDANTERIKMAKDQGIL